MSFFENHIPMEALIYILNFRKSYSYLKFIWFLFTKSTNHYTSQTTWSKINFLKSHVWLFRYQIEFANYIIQYFVKINSIKYCQLCSLLNWAMVGAIVEEVRRCSTSSLQLSMFMSHVIVIGEFTSLRKMSFTFLILDFFGLIHALV